MAVIECIELNCIGTKVENYVKARDLSNEISAQKCEGFIVQKRVATDPHIIPRDGYHSDTEHNIL